MQVPLDTPIVKKLPDGTSVVYDHLWVSYFSAQAANPNGAAKVRIILHKARDLPTGAKELYDGEDPIELTADNFFALAYENPAWMMIMGEIIMQAKLWARQLNIHT